MTQPKTFSLITLSQAEVYQHLQAALRAEGVEVDLENLRLVADEKTGNFVVEAANVRIRPAEPQRSLLAPASMSLEDARREAAAAAPPPRAPRAAPPAPEPIDPSPVVLPPRNGPFSLRPTPEELGPPVEFDVNRAAKNANAPMGPPPSQAEVNGPPPRRHRPAPESVVVADADAEPVPDHDELVRANRQLSRGPSYNRPVRDGRPASLDDMGRHDHGDQ